MIRVCGNVRFVHENQLKISKLKDESHDPENVILVNSNCDTRKDSQDERKIENKGENDIRIDEAKRTRSGREY